MDSVELPCETCGRGDYVPWADGGWVWSCELGNQPVPVAGKPECSAWVPTKEVGNG